MSARMLARLAGALLGLALALAGLAGLRDARGQEAATIAVELRHDGARAVVRVTSDRPILVAITVAGATIRAIGEPAGQVPCAAHAPGRATCVVPAGRWHIDLTLSPATGDVAVTAVPAPPQISVYASAGVGTCADAVGADALDSTPPGTAQPAAPGVISVCWTVPPARIVATGPGGATAWPRPAPTLEPTPTPWPVRRILVPINP